jgi:hypothetical protein
MKFYRVYVSFETEAEQRLCLRVSRVYGIAVAASLSTASTSLSSGTKCEHAPIDVK